MSYCQAGSVSTWEKADFPAEYLARVISGDYVIYYKVFKEKFPVFTVKKIMLRAKQCYM